ncbi:MAG: XdhC family protein [Rhodobacterales bacterium]|nr:XdhC family protein [Rhodobacterales bacterium]
MTTHIPIRDPLSALANTPEDAVLAVIIGVQGPSYRPLGAVMAILADGQRVGTLSSGCIESDVVHHAQTALENGRPIRVKYGRGSKYVDLPLPCGGGLEILLVPRPDPAVLATLQRKKSARATCMLQINPETGALSVTDQGDTGFINDKFQIRLDPEIFFYVFGKGPEASTFAGMVQSAHYPNLLLSPDDETLDFGRAAGCATRHLKQAEFPADLRPDQWSAVILFFHDHEWEPPILMSALASSAFYIGAQGSQRARDARHLEIEALGASADDLSRLKGPVGLIPSVRDARTLSVSVLAEILGVSANS